MSYKIQIGAGTELGTKLICTQIKTVYATLWSYDMKQSVLHRLSQKILSKAKQLQDYETSGPVAYELIYIFRGRALDAGFEFL